MVEEQSAIGPDARLAMLLQQGWQAEIEKAADEVKMSMLQARKHMKTDERLSSNGLGNDEGQEEEHRQRVTAAIVALSLIWLFV